MGASRRIRWIQTAPTAVLATLVSTAIIAPAGPAKAVAVGTTQKAALGETAHDSRAPSPSLRLPRVSVAAMNMTQSPPARTRGAMTSPAVVSRHAATNDSTAEVSRIWTRKMTGQALCTPGPPCEAPHPTRPPTMKHRRLSTPRLCPLLEWPVEAGLAGLARLAGRDTVRHAHSAHP